MNKNKKIQFGLYIILVISYFCSVAGPIVLAISLFFDFSPLIGIVLTFCGFIVGHTSIMFLPISHEGKIDSLDTEVSTTINLFCHNMKVNAMVVALICYGIGVFHKDISFLFIGLAFSGIFLISEYIFYYVISFRGTKVDYYHLLIALLFHFFTIFFILFVFWIVMSIFS